jgi:hypothetical protein
LITIKANSRSAAQTVVVSNLTPAHAFAAVQQTAAPGCRPASVDEALPASHFWINSAT